MPTFLEQRYCRKHLRCVRHITLDPKGRGAVRIHMIPPREDALDAPFLLLLNGDKLIPLNLSWAILLANFMDRLEPFAGLEISESDWHAMADAAVAETHKTYPFTKKTELAEDLSLMLTSLVAIARGQEPEAEVGVLSLGDYAAEMTAPHRMDLMLSAMRKDGAWHCNQKCLHCYAAGQSLADAPELSTQQWLDILRRLRSANIPQVTFTGGEPTLRADLVELVDAAQWFVTRLNTNGQLLTPELCAKLYDASLDSVQVTLYSAAPAIHNTLVGAAGFEKTVEQTLGQAATVQQQENSATGQTNLVVSLTQSSGLTTESQTELLKTLQETYPDNSITAEDVNNVDPVLGREFFKKCIVAVIFASVIMLCISASALEKLAALRHASWQ